MAAYPHTQSSEQSIIPLCSNRAVKKQKDPLHNSASDDQGNTQNDEIASEQRLLTIPQVATQLNICRAHVYTLINQGLPTIHLGRSVRISATALHHWLQTQQDS